MEDSLGLILEYLSAWDAWSCLFLNKDFYRAAKRRFATAIWDYKLSGNCNVIFKSGHVLCYADQSVQAHSHAASNYDSFECYGNVITWKARDELFYASMQSPGEAYIAGYSQRVKKTAVYSSGVGAEIELIYPDGLVCYEEFGGHGFIERDYSSAMSNLPRLFLVHGILFEPDRKPSALNKLISNTFYSAVFTKKDGYIFANI